MGTNPIGPTGPHDDGGDAVKPVTTVSTKPGTTVSTNGGAAAQPKKVEERSGKATPVENVNVIGPNGPHPTTGS
jgi:hypothetical protein